MTFQAFFGRTNILKTLLIVVLCVVFIRLGVWQLDRLEWRRGQNAILKTQIEQPAVSLNSPAVWPDLADMTDRTVTLTGQFDFDEQVIVKNKINDFGSGIHLVAPFVLDGTEHAVLIDRGWLGLSEFDDTSELANFDDDGTITLTGVVQETEKLPELATGTEDLSQGPQSEIFRISVPLLQNQSSYDLLPIYVLQTQTDDENAATRPYRAPFAVDLSEGNHLSYALQWFAFALIFGVGYLFYIRRDGQKA